MITGFEQKDLPTLNNELNKLTRDIVNLKLDRVEKVTPVVEVDETKFSHKMAVVIDGVTYYIMMTQT